MRILKRLLLALIILIVLLAVIGFLLPSKYHVERNVTMSAKPETIFPYLNNLKSWPDWTAWTTKKYPDMKTNFTGPEAGVGATYNWEGQSIGIGSIKLTNSDPNTGINYDLDFDNGKYLSKGSIKMQPSGSGVNVIWANEGDLGNNPINRYFGLLMDRFMGPDFEEGLNNLKQKVEK